MAPPRNQLYLPKRTTSDDDEDEELSDVWKEMCGEWVFEDVEGEPSDGMSFSRLLADIRREEEVEARRQNARNGEDIDISGLVETLTW